MVCDSDFCSWLTGRSGIVDLMADLGEALNVNPDILFLGGGNPAQIPEFQQYVAKHLRAICDDEMALSRLVGTYQSPQGSERLIGELERYFQDLGWPIAAENICLTNGSQSAFFLLFNMLASTNASTHILLPMLPEYLGYASQGLGDNMFRSCRPNLVLHGEQRFKYHVNFDLLNVCTSTAAICVSRPTNPTGNILTPLEMTQLGELADEKEIPLIVDCAYGSPFPGIVFIDEKDEALLWQENRIFVMSLSKLGLPGARTGIVIADKSWIDKMVKMNTVVSLANGNVGPAVMAAFLEHNELNYLCESVVLKHYRGQRAIALSAMARHFNGVDYRVHESEGAFFLWLWFPNLSVSSTELYERLKIRNVLVMDGSHFFFGLDGPWEHTQQCLRISYCADPATIEKAFGMMGSELRKLGA